MDPRSLEAAEPESDLSEIARILAMGLRRRRREQQILNARGGLAAEKENLDEIAGNGLESPADSRPTVHSG